MNEERFLWLQKLHAAASAARIQQMGLYTEGPFTRVWFLYHRDDIKLVRSARPDSRGVSVHCISSVV